MLPWLWRASVSSDRSRMIGPEDGITGNSRAIVPIAAPAGPARRASLFRVPSAPAPRRPRLDRADQTSRPEGDERSFPVGPTQERRVWTRPRPDDILQRGWSAAGWSAKCWPTDRSCCGMRWLRGPAGLDRSHAKVTSSRCVVPGGPSARRSEAKQWRGPRSLVGATSVWETS